MGKQIITMSSMFPAEEKCNKEIINWFTIFMRSKVKNSKNVMSNESYCTFTGIFSV